MNEKIKLLAEQAGMKPQDDMTKFGMGEDMNSYNCQGFILEKFAELIVRECIGILEPKSRYMGEGPEVLKDKISQIKKHFGVEL